MPRSLHACRAEPMAYRWSYVPTTGDMPPYGCCHSLINYKDKYLILFGGGALHFVNNEVHVFDLDTSTWRFMDVAHSHLVSPRISHSAVVYGDKMYVYGGQDLYMPTRFSDVFVLDLLTFSWSLLHRAPSGPDGPGDRRLHTAHIFGDRMYVLMGESSTTTNSFWYLDLQTTQWHAVVSNAVFEKPILPLLGHSAQVEEDTLYVFGGYRVNNFSQTGIFVYSNSLFCFHFPTSVWREVMPPGGPRPAPRYSAVMAVLRGRVYIHGGDTDGDVYYDDFWSIDTTSPAPRWADMTLSIRSSRPSARTGHASVVARGALYILGGELPGDENSIYYSNCMYKYPLGVFLRLPLSELVSRWLARSNRVNLRVLQQSLPLIAQRILANNNPETHKEDLDSLMIGSRDPLQE